MTPTGAGSSRHWAPPTSPSSRTRVDVTINGVKVARGGAAGDDRSLVDLSGREVVVSIDLAAGSSSASVWTNDLTAAYVHENSAYSS